MAPATTASFSFDSPVSLEGSWGGSSLADMVKSDMVFTYWPDIQEGSIEWKIEALDMCEVIGLWFYNHVLVDYDGVMDFPVQAIPFLEGLGFDMSYVKSEDQS